MEEEKKLLFEQPVSDMPPSEEPVSDSAPPENPPETPPEGKKKGFRAWWAEHKPTKRRLIQIYAALLYNANIKGFVKGTIFTGESKYVCVPGLNCYSCPGAVGACPLGALQNALYESNTRTPYYVLGIIILFGLIFARTICGFLCPVGLGQELVYKIKSPKLKKSRVTYVLSFLKYVLLAVFVVAIPILYSYQQTAIPGFCKYICPAGTFGGAIALLIHPENAPMLTRLGPLFTWKFVLLVAIVAICIFVYRAFCRFLCPLGAIYGFFNKIALLGIRLDQNSCTDCGLCVSHCKMDVRKVGDHECINCGECIDVCPANAISWKGSKLFVHKNAVEAAPASEKPLDSLLNRETEAPAESAICADGVAKKPAKAKKGKAFWLQIGAWTLALVFLLGVLLYYNVFTGDTPATPPPSGGDVTYGNTVGSMCYDFTLPLYTEDGEFTLSEQRGKIVLINFWATWCGPCVNELPEFERIAEEYGEAVQVIAIHSAFVTSPVQDFIDTKEDKYDSSRTWKDYVIKFAQDSGEGLDSGTYNLLGGRNGAYPRTLIVDAEGVISYIFPASATYESLKSQVELLLK